jgi:hypothetical protein
MARGSQPTKFVFSPEQAQYLSSLLPDFEAYVRKVNPTLLPFNEDIKKWKQDQLVKIKEHPLFSGENELPTGDHTTRQWDAVCMLDLEHQDCHSRSLVVGNRADLHESL